MPIVKINPDGTVRIVNSKTGEVKDVFPEQLTSYNPRLVEDYQELLVGQEEADQTTGEDNTKKALAQLNTLVSGQSADTGDKVGTAWKYLNSIEKSAKKNKINMGELWSVYHALQNPGNQLQPGIKEKALGIISDFIR